MKRNELEKKLKRTGFLFNVDRFEFKYKRDFTVWIGQEDCIELLEISDSNNFYQIPLLIVENIRVDLEDEEIGIVIFALNNNLIASLKVRIDD